MSNFVMIVPDVVWYIFYPQNDVDAGAENGGI